MPVAKPVTTAMAGLQFILPLASGALVSLACPWVEPLCELT